ncbi:unnamed protein product [Caenorhabditis angaria]|uniref:Uncharacterized protein n=1 Tax=Caenorhabditis angaria TaxID=860376 RepID=A0A9P1J0J6_9PELO|nr:unnamed protein product [Caenorhabditis angaria]
MDIPLLFVKNAFDAHCSTIQEANQMARSEQNPPIFTATTTIAGPNFNCLENYKFEMNENGEIINLVKTFSQNEFKGRKVVPMNEFNNLQFPNSTVQSINVQNSVPESTTNNTDSSEVGIGNIPSCILPALSQMNRASSCLQTSDTKQNHEKPSTSSVPSIFDGISNLYSPHLKNLEQLSNSPTKNGRKPDQPESEPSTSANNVMKMKMDSPPNIQLFHNSLSLPILNAQYTPPTKTFSQQKSSTPGTISNGEPILDTNFLLPSFNNLVAINHQHYSYPTNQSGNYPTVDLIENKLSIPKYKQNLSTDVEKTFKEPVEHKISFVPFKKNIDRPAEIITIDDDEEDKRNEVPNMVVGYEHYLNPITISKEVDVYEDLKFVKESEYLMLHKLMEDINHPDGIIDTLKCRLFMKFRSEFSFQYIPNEILQTCIDIILRKALSLVDGSLRHTTMTVSFHQPFLPNLKQSFEDVTYEFFNGPYLVQHIEKMRSTIPMFHINDMFFVQVDIGEQKERGIVKGHKTLLKAVCIGIAYIDQLDGQKETKDIFIELMTSKAAQNKAALQLQRKLGVTEHEANGNLKLIRKIITSLPDIKLTVISSKGLPRNYNKCGEKNITVSEVNGRFDILLPS